MLNAQLLQQAKPYVDDKQSKTFWFDIRNTDRSVGASLSGYIAQTHGDQGLAADPITAHFSGTAGQSFGVWNAGGVELYLTGDANDYVGKGMAGGLLAVRLRSAQLPQHEAASSVTPACTARPAVVCLQQAVRASVLRCVTPVLSPWWKALAITGVNT